jgi:hypothetical protein
MIMSLPPDFHDIIAYAPGVGAVLHFRRRASDIGIERTAIVSLPGLA